MTTDHNHRLRLEATEVSSKVTTLELFFDLVFVFALTQVTALMSDDLTGRGLLRGLLILGLLWWSWTAYAWLGNVVRADEGAVRPAMFAAMGVMFVLALGVPEAFDDFPGGLHGPTLVPICYFLFRLLHLVYFWLISHDDPGLRSQLFRWIPSMTGATIFLLIASQLDGATQTLFWGLALLADYGGTYLAGASGWRLPSPGHFSERHGLILIVALGESIVAIGVGVAALPVTWPVLAASGLGLLVAVMIWWIYFDITALIAERVLQEEPEETRARLARDAYSFLHFPLVVGIVFLALGLKKVLEYVGDAEQHSLFDPLPRLALYALFGGAIVYLLGHVAFKLRTSQHYGASRLLTAGGLLVILPLAVGLPALGALGLVGGALVSLVAFESIRNAELRHRLHHE